MWTDRARPEWWNFLANLGLHSITYVNDLEQDREALCGCQAISRGIERKSFRHFLEVFDPNVDSGIAPEKLGEFINDNILRTLAGVPESGRPFSLRSFITAQRRWRSWHSMSNLVVGILGGSAGRPTTPSDSSDAQNTARVAFSVAKINNAEQLVFVEMLRLITDSKVSPEEACAPIMACCRRKASSRIVRWKRIQADRPGDELRWSANQRDGHGAKQSFWLVAARRPPETGA
jgi:hypothetical protein